MPAYSYSLPQRRLVSQEDAATIQRARVPRSKFINRFSRLTTFDVGWLVPFIVDEILPGDHMRYKCSLSVRMATALFPLMSNQRIDTFWFFVPNRLVWDNWVKFMGEQDTPASSINFTVPIKGLDSVYSVPGGLPDHFGLPCTGQLTPGQTINANALPFRAYYQIWNQWFRDQNVQSKVNEPKGDGPDAENYGLLRRNKSHDYFTTLLPWPQKFTPLQTLFTGTAPIVGIGIPSGQAPTTGPVANVIETGAPGLLSYPHTVQIGDAVTGQNKQAYIRFNANAASTPPEIYADLARATGVTINALRQAWLVQDLLERDARGGTRYVELIRSHFGVTNPDFRLQRPEYIGGGQTPINVTPIAQTTPTGGGGLGALAGAGTSFGQHTASYAATEHGYIIGMVNIRTELHYQQGIHKMWTRSVRQDFYFPSLAGLGEQAVLRQELYCNGVDAEDNFVLGYQERWQELRTRYSDVAGLFRSTSAGNIDEWHLAVQFATTPTLSPAFLEENPPMARVLAAASTNMQYLADIVIERTAIRPVPTYGTPATLARF